MKPPKDETLPIQAPSDIKQLLRMAAIIPFNSLGWEMLHWLLKFLTPKLKGKSPDQDTPHERRRELDLYKRYASDLNFKRAFDASIFRVSSSKDIGSQLG
jgi:hypothetical protein